MVTVIKSSLNVSRKIPLVLKYNQFNSRILSIVRKNYLQYLSNDVDIGKMFENNFIGSFCNEKSLSNHLVKSKFMKYLVRSDVIELFAILVNLYLVELVLIHLFVVLVSVGAFRVLVKT